MALKKLNLTELKIKKQLDVLALIHPSQTYKILLSNPEFRQNLLDYIMKAIPIQYLLIESQEDFYNIKNTITCTTQEKTLIYNLVFQRFNDLRNSTKNAKPPLININKNKFYCINLESKNQ